MAYSLSAAVLRTPAAAAVADTLAAVVERIATAENLHNHRGMGRGYLVCAGVSFRMSLHPAVHRLGRECRQNNGEIAVVAVVVVAAAEVVDEDDAASLACSGRMDLGPGRLAKSDQMRGWA